MFDVLYPGRRLVISSPLSVKDVTQRLAREVAPPAMGLQFRERRQQGFEGTFADGQFSFVRLVRGRNSFRPWMKGRVSPQPNGTRVEVHLQLHMFVLVFGLVLAMAAVVLLFAALGNIEARISTRLLEKVVGATPGESQRAPQQTVAAQR